MEENNQGSGREKTTQKTMKNNHKRKKLAPKPADVLYYWEGFIHNFGELAYFIHWKKPK